MKNRPRILVADCHEHYLIATEQLLENAGFDTTTAWTGRDVIRLLDSFAFDMLLLNEYLPDGDAEHLLRVIRRRGVGTPCVVIQPSAPPMLASGSFRGLGVVALVCKYSTDELLDRLHDHFAPVSADSAVDRAIPA